MRNWLIAAMLAAPATVWAESGEDPRPVRYTIELASASKNLSLGARVRYLRYAETSIASDFGTSALLTGFGLDEVDGVRFTMSQTVGARIDFDALRLRPRHVGPAPGARFPALIVGVGAWGVTELDSLAQGARLGDNGFYAAASVGLFTTFAFSDVSVSLLYRPLSQSRYYLAGDWDSTEFNVGNPVLDIDLSWTFP